MFNIQRQKANSITSLFSNLEQRGLFGLNYENFLLKSVNFRNSNKLTFNPKFARVLYTIYVITYFLHQLKELLKYLKIKHFEKILIFEEEAQKIGAIFSFVNFLFLERSNYLLHFLTQRWILLTKNKPIIFSSIRQKKNSR